MGMVHHRIMMTRDDRSAVIVRLRRHHRLLAAFLEAADKVGRRRMAICETPKRFDVEAAGLAQVEPSAAPFAFRRTNLTVWSGQLSF